MYTGAPHLHTGCPHLPYVYGSAICIWDVLNSYMHTETKFFKSIYILAHYLSNMHIWSVSICILYIVSCPWSLLVVPSGLSAIPLVAVIRPAHAYAYDFHAPNSSTISVAAATTPCTAAAIFPAHANTLLMIPVAVAIRPAHSPSDPSRARHYRYGRY